MTVTTTPTSSAAQPAAYPTASAQPVKYAEPVPQASVPMGAPVQQTVRPATTSGKAIASLVCGIIGILIFGIILGPLAICLGVSAKNDIKARPGELGGTCQADAGIICGAVALVIWVIVVVLYV